VEAVVVPETVDKDYIMDQIEMFKMSLEDEKDQEQRDYLTDQIEMFEMGLQDAPEANIPAPASTKKNVKVTTKIEPVVMFREGGNVATGTGTLSSYKDLVDEGLMTEAEFVTFMREKGYKVMKKSVYNEIKGIDDYDFMIKILGYNNLI
jgi:hypothetical protein